MTADAKVGLLLGLFFIVIIAFLVNGLPNFIKDSKPDEVQTVTITPPTAPDLSLDNNVNGAIEKLRPLPLRPRVTEPPKEVVVFDAAQPRVELPAHTTPPSVSPAPVEPELPAKVIPAVPDSNVIHVVQSGENLAAIAQKYYGSEQGNRYFVINKLYEANANVIPSADRVCVGDKLTIPSLEQLLDTQSGVVQTPKPTESLLQKFSNIFERANNSDAGKLTEYIVQEGDSLWSIAEETLGSGNRYSEIAKLNKISNTNELKAGISLKIPTQ